MDNKWIDHWISDLVSQKLIDEKTFHEWMWCGERYIEEDLLFMEYLWGRRKNE